MIKANRGITLLIAALGGEGGGVLADWIIEACVSLDLPVQSTSIPGVSQRTGATTYYLEIFPVPRSELNKSEPVMSLVPSPGEVDIVLASELLEAARVIQNGFVDASNTTLIFSTHREYAVVEKSSMADGRVDSDKIIQAAQALAHKAVFSDLKSIAIANNTVINTVMFGALVGSKVLPLTVEACENAIRKSGKAVDASLKGFAAGIELVTKGNVQNSPANKVKNSASIHNARIQKFPIELQEIAKDGFELVLDYQDKSYAELYLDRLQQVFEVEYLFHPSEFKVTREVARYLALWMSYEDVIRVADLKSRWSRLQRVRKEVGAKSSEPMILTEFLKPGINEICAILPKPIANKIQAYCQKRNINLGFKLKLKTNTLLGFMQLVFLRNLKVIRKFSSQFQAEQDQINLWLSLIKSSLKLDQLLAYELALCGNLVKGYGSTSERGHENINKILKDVQSSISRLSAEELILRVSSARQASLSDPEGRAVSRVLGLPEAPPKVQVIKFVKRSSVAKQF